MLETMSPDAQKLYMAGCEKDEWKACQMAWEWDTVLGVIAPAIKFSEELHNAHNSGVIEFIRTRIYHRWFPK